MMLTRLRNAAVAGTAVLLLSGAGIAFAGNSPTPMPASAPVVAAQPAAGVSSATAQQVDLQQGDQTAPDAAGTAAAEAAGVEAPESAAEAASTAAETAGTETAATETDGPGGHADAAGANVDYQFQGEQ
ncbi:MAG: hypothetical protein ACP5VP_05415 [Candidatus Limnocylindrales bacterium]